MKFLMNILKMLILKLEDQMVLKRSPDLVNKVKIGQEINYSL